MIRLILAIITGMVVITLLSVGTDHIFHITHVYPPYGVPMYNAGLLLLATAYRFVFQVLGSWLASAIARSRASAAVWTMGIVGVVMWIAGMIAMKDAGPAWYPLLGAALSIPSSLLGRQIYYARHRRQNNHLTTV